MLDRNARCRLMLRAELYDRRSHLPGQHGGALKRTGLAVLKALAFTFHNAFTGRTDPSYEALAAAAGVARSTVGEALRRLRDHGFLAWTQRRRGRRMGSNRYHLTSQSGSRIETNHLGTPKSASHAPPPVDRAGARRNAAGDGRHAHLLRALEARERRLGLG